MVFVRGLALATLTAVACSGDNKPSLTITAPSAQTVDDSYDDDDDDDDDDGPSPTTAGPGATEGPGTGGSTSGAPTTEAATSEGPTTDVTTDVLTTDVLTGEGPTTPAGICGDGVKDRGEACDFEDLGGQSCEDLGYIGGALYCSFTCEFDESLCASGGTCGDGVVDEGEGCDCVGSCSASELGGMTCSDLMSPADTPFTGGTLGCTGGCAPDTSSCAWCGDGALNGSELCDGNSLGGKTCVSLGYSGGTLKCDSCGYDTSGCAAAATCGDGTCSGVEDPCNCESDCPNDPYSCSPCECGGVSESCGCDLLCIQFGDCCDNGPC